MIEVNISKDECKFCSESFTGDCNASLIEDQLRIFNSAEMFLGVDVFINDNELELYIDDSVGDGVLKRKVPINYCPMCGRPISNADVATGNFPKGEER